ncbi:MAG: type II toxin-antitoxin system RelE/ParE family toxin [Crocosphaera sp.]
MYQIEFSKKAQKRFKALPKSIKKRLIVQINLLSENPRPLDCKKLKGVRDLFRLRVGDYRVIYAVEDELLLILVVEVGHGREIYRDY